jgi:hypothetical protein
MTTPATANTAGLAITLAMRDAGLLKKGSDPDADDLADGMIRLTAIIKYLQTQGLKLWLQTDLSVPLVAGQAKYSLSPTGNVVMAKPMRVLQGYYQDASSNRRPIDPPLSRDEYTRLSNLVQTGAITSYFVDKQQTSLDIYLWQTPDTTAATGTVHLLIQQQVATLVSVTDTMNFPEEWFLALHWALADELSTGQPQAIVDRCAKRAALFLAALEAWDVEDASTSFAPDSRGMYQTGGFR